MNRPCVALLAILVALSGCAPPDEEDRSETSAALGALSVDTWLVDFGRVPCEGFRFSQRISMRNSGPTDVSYRAQFRDFRSQFEVSPASGSVRAGGYEWLDVSFSRFSFTPLLPGVIDDDLEIEGGTFGFPHRVPVRATVVGALLSQDRTTIDFGPLASTDAVTEEIELRNGGNEAAYVNARTFAPFEVSPSSAFVSVGSRTRFTVRFDPATAHGYQSSQVQFSHFDRVCGESLKPVWVRATAP